MAHTKGTFKDGHTGWKVLVLEPNHSIGIQKGYSVIWSDDEEHITDYVYEYDDAKLIAAAPQLLEAIQYYFDVLEEVRGKDWSENLDHVTGKMVEAVNKATL